MEAAASGCGLLQSLPCKVLSGQLQLSASRSGQNPAWLLERAGSGRAPLDVSVVWIQGTVLEARPDGNTTLQLRDQTGTFTVVGAGGVPKCRPCTSRGKYVMVMGVVQSCSPEPMVRAVKVTDLSGLVMRCTGACGRLKWRTFNKTFHRFMQIATPH